MNERDEDFDLMLDDLFEHLREGTAQAAEIAELERLLHGDPALRKRYRARVRMEEELAATFQEPVDMVLPFAVDDSKSRISIVFAAISGIAAIIVAILAIGFLTREKPPLTVATLESSSSVRWELPPVFAGDSSRVAPGEVRLESGVAHFRFDSGAIISLEGPAALIIESPMRTRLLSGRALVEAPESAQGFVVAIPHGETVDLGTLFSVSVTDETTACEVLEGRVIMRHGNSRQAETLDEGQAMMMNPDGILPLGYRPSMNFPPEAKRAEVFRTTAETTVVSSNLRDRYVDERMLLVKMETGSTAQRRALFNIRLDGIRPHEIESANLKLNLVPSKLGFAAYLPETVTFAVYGISDESREDWFTANPKWEEVPGYVAGDESMVNPAETTLLGKLEINRGQQRGLLTLETEELREFLRSDTTGTVGFLIVRETDGTATSSLVHAMASSLHPEASGPSLEVVLAE